MKNATRAAEVAGKIAAIRGWMGEGAAVRLRGIDWFAWVTAGGSSAVLLAAETGIAEVLVTQELAWVLTDEIEAPRLKEEELPAGLQIRATSWAVPFQRESLVRELTQGLQVYSDRPSGGEEELMPELVAAKRALTPPEIERYREVGALAAEAMTQALFEALPEWSEHQLAAAGGRALLARGLDPALVMAAGERRMRLFRHPMPTSDTLGASAMLVFCARGHGLYANLTRFVSFAPLPNWVKELHRQVREVEAIALNLSRPGTHLGAIYEALAKGYADAGHEHAIREHHQGGTTGYLSREVVATPGAYETIEIGTAVAWNPSLPGAKVEDTFVVTESGLSNLTVDPHWPTVRVAERDRPLVLER